MTQESTRLSELVRRGLEGQAWHGPALLDVLAGVSAEAAAAHPVHGAHSIWEIVLHLAATYRVVLRRIQGESGDLTADEDWPAVGAPIAQRWHEAIEQLRALNGELRLAIAACADTRLEQELAPGHSSGYMHFAGVPQHDAYHAGQIALLRKAMLDTAVPA